MNFGNYTVEALSKILIDAINGENFELASQIRDVVNSRGGADTFMDLETQTAIIIKNMDFDKIHDVMDYLEWGYGFNQKIPSVDNLIDKAKSLLNNVWYMEEGHETVSMETGGFRCERYIYDGLKMLKLSFVLSSWDIDYQSVKLTYDQYTNG